MQTNGSTTHQTLDERRRRCCTRNTHRVARLRSERGDTTNITSVGQLDQDKPEWESCVLSVFLLVKKGEKKSKIVEITRAGQRSRSVV